MTHDMHLNNEPFEKIKKGIKKIEMRLNDEKRKIIKIGDEIVFSNRDNGEIIKAKVVNLHYFESFKEMYEKLNKESLGYLKDEKCSYLDMEKYYSKDEQEKYGVVGIEISLN